MMRPQPLAHSLTDILFTGHFLHFNPFWLAERYRSISLKNQLKNMGPRFERR